MDTGFLDRVVKMSVAVSVFVAWFLLALTRYQEAASFAIGAALSLFMLWSARYAIGKTLTTTNVVPGRKKGKLGGRIFAVALAIGKYGIAGYIVWRLVKWPYADLPWFAGGVAVTQAVLLLKALGIVLSGNAEPRPARWDLKELGRLTRSPKEPGRLTRTRQ